MTRAELLSQPGAELAPGPVTTGRSSLLRAGLVSTARPRRFFTRALLGFSALGLLAFGLVGTALNLWPATGAGWLAYWLHDTIWLPLYGSLWLAPFPQGFVWALPAGLLILLVGLEFLGWVAILRGLQAGIWRLVFRRLPSGLAGALARLAPARGQALAVLDELCAESLSLLLAEIETAGPASRSHLAEASRFHALRCRVLTEAPLGVQIAAIEVLCAALWADQPLPEPLVAAVDGSAPGARALRLAATEPLDVAEIATLPRLMSKATGPLAATTLAMALAARTCPEALTWFQAWAERQYRAPNPVLGEAEGLIAFELWASLAEARRRAPAPDPLLVEALGPNGLSPRALGEVFARKGAP